MSDALQLKELATWGNILTHHMMDLVSQYRYGTDPVYVINEQIYTVVDYWNK